MVSDPYSPEPPFEYECIECEAHFEGDASEDDLGRCPECGGSLWNLSIPSHE